VEDHSNNWRAQLTSFPFPLSLNRFPLPYPIFSTGSCLEILQSLGYRGFQQPFLPPLSPLQTSDLEWVNSITGGLSPSPLELTQNLTLSSNVADPPAPAELGSSATPSIPSDKGYFSTRLKQDDFSGGKQTYSTREPIKKHSTTTEGATRASVAGPRLKRKSLKNKGRVGNLALGEDVEINQVTEMENQTIVGWVNGRIFATKTIREWIHSAWKEELGYLPELVELNRNWYAFTFQTSEHSKWVLSKSWSINNSPFLLKPWNPLFDASTERLDKILVWVRLPALPFHLWSFDYFKKIGNFLGDFLDEDMSFEETKQRKVARILVNLNVREGLGEEMDLSWGGYTYAKKLDYENIPFRCRRCHQYGHLVKNCKLPLRTKGTVYGRYKDSQKTVGYLESALSTQKEQGSQTKDMSIDFVQPNSELATMRSDQQTSVLEGATSFPVSGTSSNPGPSITVLINNLSIKSPEWLLSPSLPQLPPLNLTLPSFFPLPVLPPPLPPPLPSYPWSPLLHALPRPQRIPIRPHLIHPQDIIS
jgi:hypothetical protein